MTLEEIVHLWTTRGFEAVANLVEGPLLIPLEPWHQPPVARRTIAVGLTAGPDPSQFGASENTATVPIAPRRVQSSVGEREPAPRVQVATVVKTQRNAYAHVAIGRSGQNDIILDQASISRFHADIRWTEGIYAVRDCRSRNGTKLNGAPVVANHGQPLRAGDVITFGEAPCLFCPIEEAALELIFARFAHALKR